MNYYDLINKIKDKLNEETTMSAITYLPSQVGVVKAFIGNLASEADEWDLEILDKGKDYKSVLFGKRAAINVPNKHWKSFNKLFGGSIEGSKSLKVRGLFEANKTVVESESLRKVLEANIDELKSIRSELMRAIQNFFNLRKFKVLRLIYLNFRKNFKIKNATSPNCVVALNDIDKGILNLYGNILKEYGEDRGTLEMIVEAFKEQKSLGKFGIFGKNDFICGLVVESNFEGVVLVLSLGVDINDVSGAIQQSLYVGSPDAIDEIKDRKDVKTVGSKVYPTGDMFTDDFFSDLNDLLVGK